MKRMKAAAAVLLMAALLLSACSGQKEPEPAPSDPTAPTETEWRRPELEAPINGALVALKNMNTYGKEKDFVAAAKEFATFREHWEVIRVPLRDEDPKLEQHIEDGAIELDVEFKKPEEQIRVYELDEETVKLGRLLADAAEILGSPFNQDLVQKDPTEEIPYNQEQVVEIILSDHKFEPSFIELEQHTKVTFRLINQGPSVHEFDIGYYAVEVEDIQPGETRELTFTTIDAGEFEFSCHIPGHYEVGMFGTIKVNPAELRAQ